MPENNETNMRDVGFVTAFKSMQADVHHTAISKGWHEKRMKIRELVHQHCDGDRDLESFATNIVISQMLLLCHAEISEGVEGMRGGKMDDKIPEFTMLEAEIADTIIRFMDLAETFELRVAEAVVAKAAMNKGREKLHGGKQF